jgi:hypothetical protein
MKSSGKDGKDALSCPLKSLLILCQPRSAKRPSAEKSGWDGLRSSAQPCVCW